MPSQDDYDIPKKLEAREKGKTRVSIQVSLTYIVRRGENAEMEILSPFIHLS